MRLEMTAFMPARQDINNYLLTYQLLLTNLIDHALNNLNGFYVSQVQKIINLHFKSFSEVKIFFFLEIISSDFFPNSTV